MLQRGDDSAVVADSRVFKWGAAKAVDRARIHADVIQEPEDDRVGAFRGGEVEGGPGWGCVREVEGVV